MKFIQATFLVMVVAMFSSVASASPFSSLVVYGDSLSDNGNLFAVVGYPGAPYYNGRASNGPVAVEYLASELGVPLVDFAWYGATTGVGNFADGGTPTSFGYASLPGMLTVYAGTKGSLGPIIGSGLFVIWGGPNDYWGHSPLDTTPQEMIARSVGDLLAIVEDLRYLGAMHIMVPGMPDLGLTPLFLSGDPLDAAQATAYTDAFNAALMASLPPGVIFFDTSSFMRSIIANPAAYGFTNITDPCFNGSSVCSNPDQYAFFDIVHPTTAFDELFAKEIAATVPEPGTLILVAAGLGAIGVVRRVRSRRSA